MNYNHYLFMKELQRKVNTIPKKNKHKFFWDYAKLIDLAHKDNYEDFELQRHSNDE